MPIDHCPFGLIAKSTVITIDSDPYAPLIAALVESTAERTRRLAPYNWRRLWLAIACHLHAVWIERSPSNLPEEFVWFEAASARLDDNVQRCSNGDDVRSSALEFSDYYQDVLDSVGYEWLPIVGCRIVNCAQALVFACEDPAFSDEDHLLRMARALHETHDYFYLIGDASMAAEVERHLGPSLGLRYVQQLLPTLIELSSCDAIGGDPLRAFLRYERAVILHRNGPYGTVREP